MRPSHVALDVLDGRVLLARHFQSFAQYYPEQSNDADAFIALLSDPEAFLRTRLAGHFTGSAWLVSADGERVLLTHHRKLRRWFQLGGACRW